MKQYVIHGPEATIGPFPSKQAARSYYRRWEWDKATRVVVATPDLLELAQPGYGQ
jgi:hypothetical protein